MSEDVFDRLAAVNPIANDEAMPDTMWSASLLRAVIDERRGTKSGATGRLANRFKSASRWSGPMVALAAFVIAVVLGALTFFALVRPTFEPASPPPSVATPPPVVGTTTPAATNPPAADSSTSPPPSTEVSTTTSTLPTVPFEGSIVYSALKNRIHYDVHVASATDGNSRLTSDEASQVQPDWSPDGQLVVYLDDGRNVADYDVWIIEVATGQRTQFTQTTGRESSPRFAPDGQSIAYAIDGDIVIADLAGVELIRLSVGASRVTWSPDGTQLAYVTIGAQDTVSTTTLAGETSLILEGWDTGETLDWGPEGIVLELTEPGAGGEPRVTLISDEGSILQQFDPGWIDPSWGPDGRILVVDAATGDIGWLDGDGSYTGPLVIVAESDAETPVWNPFEAASE